MKFFGIEIAFDEEQTELIFRRHMRETTAKPCQADRVLDLKGWGCPWVILKAKSWLSRMNAGEILEVISSDAQIQKSFSHVLERTNDRVISIKSDEDCYHVLVKRGPEAQKVR